jgi:signal peptidase I
MKSIAKKIFSWVLIGILIVVVGINAYIFYLKSIKKVELPLIFNFTSAIVLSGSMKPAIDVNDAVIVHKERNYEVGDVIMFREKADYYTTHRIVQVESAGYITRGDANNIDDEQISKKQIIGKVVFIIPKVGIIQEFLFTPIGFIAVIILGGAIILLSSEIALKRMVKK